MSLALATKGVICPGGFSQGTPIYYYYCVELPEVLSSKSVSPAVKAQNLSTKIIMDSLDSHPVVNNLVAEKTIEDLIPKLSIKS